MNGCDTSPEWFNNNGPGQVFCRFYTELGQKLYTYLLLRTRDTELARDISHDVFLKFWILRDSYAQIGDLKAYLFHMDRNAIYDIGRQEKRQRTYKEYMEQQANLSQNITQDMYNEWELHRKIQQAIWRLSGQRRKVFVLSKLESWPRKKIAKALDISESTVKATLQNAEKDIQKFTGVAKKGKTLGKLHSGQ